MVSKLLLQFLMAKELGIEDNMNGVGFDTYHF